MKIIIPFIILLILISCKQEVTIDNRSTLTDPVTQDTTITSKNSLKSTTDTLIVKHKNNDEYYLNSFSYHWINHKDTIDFNIHLRHYSRDTLNRVSVTINHKETILFATAVKRIEECFKIIKEDFEISELSSIQFRMPILYQEIATEISKDYLDKFGIKKIKSDQLNEFLMNSQLTAYLEQVLHPINKSVGGYHIEKFGLTQQRLDIDYNTLKVPEASLHGMGILVYIKDKE